MFAGDINPKCKETYFANYKISDDQWHTDITKFDATPYRNKVDLLVGGAPCQAFSLRGEHGGFNDTRVTLFREFARVVIETSPKVFIFENVKGMLSHDKGKTWEVIKETFAKDCGYDIHFSVLNARNFGIPQNRERLFCIGFKNKTSFDFPLEEQLSFNVFDFLDKEVTKKYFLKAKGAAFITKNINNKKSYTQINGDILLCQKRNQQFNWHGDFIYHPLSNNLNKEGLDDILFDVDQFENTDFLSTNLEKYVLTKKDSDTFLFGNQTKSHFSINTGAFRKLTPRECLSLMGFSKDFVIPISDTEAYKQDGNSIVVKVLMALLKKMDITIYGEER